MSLAWQVEVIQIPRLTPSGGLRHTALAGFFGDELLDIRDPILK